jgi:hypothetical protein
MRSALEWQTRRWKAFKSPARRLDLSADARLAAKNAGKWRARAALVAYGEAIVESLAFFLKDPRKTSGSVVTSRDARRFAQKSVTCLSPRWKKTASSL